MSKLQVEKEEKTEKCVHSTVKLVPSLPNRPAIQQDNNYEEFMTWITDGGLRYAVAKHSKDPNADTLFRKKVDPEKRRHVIIVGAGLAGLSAAYELSQSGHQVTILESNSCVGGRVKTFREKFAEGIHVEGGAMRLPPNHFLTKHDIDLFKLETRTFQNYNKKGYIYMDMFKEKVTMKEFESRNKYYTDKWFPGWDANLSEELKKKLKISGILSLYALTIEPVKNELGKTPTKEQWKIWIEKWSKLSVEDYFRSTIYQSADQDKLRPWTEEAIQAFQVTTYTSQLFGVSLVAFLRDELGEWWEEPLYTLKNGMDCLPKAFMNKNENGWNKDVDLSKNIKYGIRVEKVEEKGCGRVQVTGTNIYTGTTATFEGDAVFLTVPLPILRQLDVPFSAEKHKALANIRYESSTKIMLQCKTRFWQKELGQGGFSKTNMQIGQLHYPDYDGSGIADDERGILVVYNWGSDALTFGAQEHKDAIKSAVKQISKIHPEIFEEFEVGAVQAWYSDPSAQGAFALPAPFDYMNAFATLIKSTKPIYLAGDAFSWSNGWIQGAIFSALMQAFCFQELVEIDKRISPMEGLHEHKIRPGSTMTLTFDQSFQVQLKLSKAPTK